MEKAPKCTSHLKKGKKKKSCTVFKRTNLLFAFTLKDKQIVEMVDAKVLNALKGYSDDKSHFMIQTFTVFLRGKLNFGDLSKNVLELNCNIHLHFPYRSISLDKVKVITHIAVLQ